MTPGQVDAIGGVDWACVGRLVAGLKLERSAAGLRALIDGARESLGADGNRGANAAEVVAAAAVDFDRLEAMVVGGEPKPGARRRWRESGRMEQVNPDRATWSKLDCTIPSDGRPVTMEIRPVVDGPVRTFREWDEAVAKIDQARADESARRIDDYARRAGRPMSLARRLAVDQDLRRRLGEAAGARVSGDFVRDALCPSCGRRSVWWSIVKGWARCDHSKSCAWSGDLGLLAGVLGLDSILEGM